MGAVYAALTRLEAKGYVRSTMSEPTQVRGGTGRRVFEVTSEDARTLTSLRRERDRIWTIGGMKALWVTEYPLSDRTRSPKPPIPKAPPHSADLARSRLGTAPISLDLASARRR
jgi:hypothetical protein